MLQCTPTKCDISNPYCRTGKEGAYCDYEDPDKSRDPWTESVRALQKNDGHSLVRFWSVDPCIRQIMFAKHVKI